MKGLNFTWHIQSEYSKFSSYVYKFLFYSIAGAKWAEVFETMGQSYLMICHKWKLAPCLKYFNSINNE
jgi:hypothetical protein